MRDAMAAIRAQQWRKTVEPFLVQRRLHEYVCRNTPLTVEAIPEQELMREAEEAPPKDFRMNLHPIRILPQLELRRDTDDQQKQ